MADPSSNQKRYTPPNQRNSTKNHKKPGDRTGGNQNKGGERTQPQASGFNMEDSPQKIITLKDCSRSEAYHCLKQRWAKAMHQYNDPAVDLSERPIRYYGGNGWGKLPHQILATAKNALPPPVLPADYITEVRRGLLAPKSSSKSSDN